MLDLEIVTNPISRDDLCRFLDRYVALADFFVEAGLNHILLSGSHPDIFAVDVEVELVGLRPQVLKGIAATQLKGDEVVNLILTPMPSGNSIGNEDGFADRGFDTPNLLSIADLAHLFLLETLIGVSVDVAGIKGIDQDFVGKVL